MITRIRPLILFLLALAVQVGFLSPEFAALVEANADAIIGGILGLWSLIAFLRNRKAARFAQEGAGRELR